MCYCTTNGLKLTVEALPSRPSAQVYQLPGVFGVGTYAPHKSVFTSIAAVQLDGGVDAAGENPNWIGEALGETRALTPIAPLP